MLPAKTFSLEDANKALPVIRTLFTSFFSLRGRMEALAQDRETLFDIWGDDVLRKGNLDHSLYLLNEKKRQDALVQIRMAADRIAATGVGVKDINNGVIDFYGELNGKAVFFCWRYGEETVGHWHPLNEGFDSRKEITVNHLHTTY